MKLYLIRHGESEGNAQKLYSGWMQHSLTSKGEEDAIRARNAVSNIRFDKVYSSDLVRAIQTQKIVLPEAECEQTELLREINVGILAGKTYAECTEKYGHLYRSPSGNNYDKVGGESRSELKERLGKFLDLVASSDYERVAAFSHAGVIRSLLSIIVGENIKTLSFDCNNCCICVFEYKNDCWRVSAWNYTGELK